MMAGIKGRDTKPELMIRRGLHALGFRYRLHVSSLPGKPDIVLRKYRAVILVNGCFWHRHECHLFKWPSTRREFWHEKLERNVEVDRRSISALRDTGWRVLVIWECALKGRTRLALDEVVRRTSNWLLSDSAWEEISGGR